MKQTKNHKLNLIEMSDTFSTEPLNQNMETIDTALKAASDTAAAISKRVVSLETRHMVFGTYTGNGTGYSKTIDLGFMPEAVVIGGPSSNVIRHLITDSSGTCGDLTASGFRVSGSLNTNGRIYNYIAFD